MALRNVFGLVLCVSVMSATPGVAADPGFTDRIDSPRQSRITDVEHVGGGDQYRPRISGELHERTDTVLLEAFPVALQRIRDNSECRDLFADLGADGLEKMKTSLYRATTAQMEIKVCKRGVSAFTYVSTPQVRLCRRFGALGTEGAATTLIHEALHWAGLGEYPVDKDGLRARDIDRMVRKACDL